MFDPSQHITLSALNSKITTVVEDNFKSLEFWVIADVTNHSYKEQTNYHYFDLVEKSKNSNSLLAKIAGKAWGNGSIKIKEFEKLTGQKFSNNINVLIRVKVNFHAVYGLSLDIQDIDANFTIGELEQQRQSTLKNLVNNHPEIISKIGDIYSTRNNNLFLPCVIQRIAIVSSKTSAGNEDFKHTLQNNQYGYKFEVREFHTAVQNEVNANLFVDALIEVFLTSQNFDVVVIIRGGGAQTDFLIFDNYKVGLAVAKFPIPIITGIGHHKNETIADLMAHTQTKTPTKAAELIISHNKRFEEEILGFQKNVVIKSQQILSRNLQLLSARNSFIVNSSRNFLNDYKDGLVMINQTVINKTKTILFQHKNSLSLTASSIISKPKTLTGNKQNDLRNIVSNIKVFKSMFLRNQSGYLGHYTSIIKLMSPVNILNKGFAIVKLNDNVVSNPDKIEQGDEIKVILKDQSLTSIVKSKTDYDGHEFEL